jgi:hypothetical protein
MWRVMEQVLKKFIAQEHDKWQSPSVFYCGIFHLQNICQCTCIRYNLVLFAVFFFFMFWVSHLINQNNTTTFCIITKYFLSCKTFKLAPPNLHTEAPIIYCLSAALYCPSIPPTDPVQLLCLSTWPKLGLLWIACYEMWQFCSLLNAIRWYKLHTHNSNTFI